MTDGLNQNLNQVAMQPEIASPVNQAPMASQERMVPQSEVDKLAWALKNEHYEKGRRDALAQTQTQSNHGAQQVAQGALSEDQVRNMISEQTLKVQQEQARVMHAERIVGEFAGKMEAGPELHPDFEEVVKTLDLRAMPEIVQLANSVGNTADIMYDLAQNPYKIAQLKTLANMSPHMARAEMARLSKSIEANKQAISQVSTQRQPLGQMKPSTQTVESGPMTLNDFKNASWLRK